MTSIRSIFKPPQFEDEEKTRKAFLLHVILWVLILVTTLFFIYKLIALQQVTQRLLIQVFFGFAANAFLLILTRRGYVFSASIIQVAAFWTFFTITAWTSAGIDHQAYQIGYALVITIAGLLLGIRGALIMVGVSLLSGGLMLLVSGAGLWSFKPPDTTLVVWVISAILFPVLAVIQYLGERLLRMTLAQSQISEAKYRLLADNIKDHLFLMDLNLNPTYISPSVEKSRGYTFEEFAKLPLEKRVTATSIKAAQEYLAVEMPKAMADPEYYPVAALEIEVYRKDGSTLWMETTYTAIRNGKGNLTSILGVGRDITERRRAEEASQASEERFRLLAENARDTIWTMDLNFRYTYMSPYVKQTLDYTPEEYVKLPLDKVLTPSSLEKCLASFAEEMEIEKREDKDLLRSRTMELEHIGRNGRIVPVEMKLTFIRNRDGIATGILGYTRDITDRKRAEDAQRKSEDKYRTLIETTGTGFVIIDHDGKVQDANPEYVRMTGHHDLSEILGRSVIEWTAEYEKEKNTAAVQACFDQGHIRNFQIDYVDLKGNITPIEINATCMTVEGKTLTITLCRDITDRKRIEDSVRQSEEKYRTILESIEEGYFEQNLTGDFIFLSDSMCLIYGYPKEELLGMNYKRYTDKLNGKKCLDVYRNIFSTGQPGKVIDFEIIRKDGTRRHLESSVSLQKDSAGKPIAFRGIVRDVTEQKLAQKEKQNLEERLQRAEKMEALGTLAGGVAHDLNNVLGVIVGYAELLSDEVDKSSPIRPALSRIMNGSEKAAAIVQDLLTLARRGVPGRKVLNLNKIVLEYQHSPEFEKLNAHHQTVRIRTELEPDLLNISGSAVHLGKALSNLAANAAEAMPRGGNLTIKTFNQYLDKPILGYDTVREGDYVVLSVADTGEGIPSADQQRIFEPFYTKKIMGRSGSGLGLAVVWGTVKDHSGYIIVQSKEGMGSTFTLYFPVTRENVAVEAAVVPVSEYIGKGEVILVVDDVKEQCEMAAAMLTKLNYQVSFVESGEAAVDYMKEHSADLMVLDMIMDPGMDGLDTYKAVLKIRPGQKAIIVSGFSETDRVNEAHALGAGAYLRKPYVLEKLGVAVRKELDRIIQLHQRP